MSEEDFYAFTFGNAVRLWTSLNPDFFKGTMVEGAAKRFIDDNATITAVAQSQTRI
jgi:hypothetical protein